MPTTPRLHRRTCIQSTCLAIGLGLSGSGGLLAATGDDLTAFETQLKAHVPARPEQTQFLRQTHAAAAKVVLASAPAASNVPLPGADADNHEASQIRLWEAMSRQFPAPEQWRRNAEARLAKRMMSSTAGPDGAGKLAVGSWTSQTLGMRTGPTNAPRASGALMDVRYGYDHVRSRWTLYAAALGGGLWQQIPFLGGPVWSPLTDSLPGSQGIGGFWVDPADSRRIIVGTGVGGGRYPGTGPYRTTDGGANWSLFQMDGITPSAFYKLAGDRFKPATVYACADEGFFRSRDRGQTWVREHPGRCSDFAQVSGAAGDNDGVMLLALWGGAIQYAAVDQGNFSWAVANTSGITGSINRITLAGPANRGDSPLVYAMVTDASNNSNGVFRSNAFGVASWTKISGAIDFGSVMGFHANAVEVHPDNPAIVAVGMVSAYLSENANAATPTWEFINTGTADYTDFEFVPAVVAAGNTRVVAANDGGVHVYDWQTNTVDLSENGKGMEVHLVMGNVASMSQSHANRNLIGAGLWDTGNALLELGAPVAQRFRYLGGADGGSIGLSTDNASEMISTAGAPWSRYWSRDGGATWSQIDLGCPAGTLDDPMITPWGLVLEPTRNFGGRAYTYSARINRSVNPPVNLDARIWRRSIGTNAACSEWTALHAGSLPSDFRIATTDREGDFVNLSVANNPNADLVWINRVGTRRVVVLEGLSPNMSINNRDPALSGFDPTGIASTLQAERNPGRPDTAYFGMLTFGGNIRLAVTHDRGVTWTNVTGNLNTIALGEAPQELIASSIDPRQMWVATKNGIYQSNDRGATWFAVMEGLPVSVDVTQLEYDPTVNPPRLIIGTYGRGIYTREFPLPVTVFANGFEP